MKADGEGYQKVSADILASNRRELPHEYSVPLPFRQRLR